MCTAPRRRWPTVPETVAAGLNRCHLPTCFISTCVKAAAYYADPNFLSSRVSGTPSRIWVYCRFHATGSYGWYGERPFWGIGGARGPVAA